MKNGFFSGALWGLDTFILGLAFAFSPFSDSPQASLCSAFMHDLICSLILIVFLTVRGKMRLLPRALKTRGARAVMIGALLGGPIGMSGYLAAINNIGAAHTAIISAFYPACGTFLAVVFLRESFSLIRGAALLAALGGIIAIGTSGTAAGTGGNAAIGIAGALICVFGWGSEAVFLAWSLRGTEELDCETALCIREVTGTTVYVCAVIPATGGFPFVGKAVTAAPTLLVAAAAAAGVASYLFYYRAISLVGAAKATALNISYCAWALIYTSLWMFSFPTGKEIVCCILIFAGTVLSATEDLRSLLRVRNKENGAHGADPAGCPSPPAEKYAPGGEGPADGRRNAK